MLQDKYVFSICCLCKTYMFEFLITKYSNKSFLFLNPSSFVESSLNIFFHTNVCPVRVFLNCRVVYHVEISLVWLFVDFAMILLKSEKKKIKMLPWWCRHSFPQVPSGWFPQEITVQDYYSCNRMVCFYTLIWLETGSFCTWTQNYDTLFVVKCYTYIYPKFIHNHQCSYSYQCLQFI